MAETRVRRSRRPVRALAALFLVSALALAGCSSGQDSDSGDSSKAEAASQQQAGAGADSASDSKGGSAGRATRAPDPTASHIIRTASLTVRVKDVPKALEAARTTTENAGGFVGGETTTRDDKGRERTRVTLRVPTDKYEEVLGDLEGSGELVEREAKAEDVTDQVVDVESRITSQRASVARIRELMDRATKLSDVVTLEGELSSRQADLEALLARQASLKDRTSLATIRLSLTETPVKKAGKDDDPGFLDALAGGWNAFVTMFRWIALALGALLPFLLGGALLVLVWVRLVRPRLPRRPATASASAMSALGPLPQARPAPGSARPQESQESGEQD
ncbi:DUF4349 domain-containing protein [Streptomyces sp. KM273126]|uniref:DUF4349 domain-containing protein n=1 Tax=Streptomyces sp. KM273126 TaxID=2545247 RepID=UPI001039E76D|nr:DUF4349 domain-containing protein [Streptomyces sp. KM273126]MBA2809714.1 DUF4349 domain-containing protein [Streptomyces sp. KM273126]